MHLTYSVTVSEDVPLVEYRYIIIIYINVLCIYLHARLEVLQATQIFVTVFV